MTKKQLKELEDAKFKYLKTMLKVCKNNHYPFDLSRLVKKSKKNVSQ